MMPILLALFTANYKVHGVPKLCVAATRAGHDIGRDQVGRLTGQLGIQGASRRRKVSTTTRDDDTQRPDDLVDRDFTADRPNRFGSPTLRMYLPGTGWDMRASSSTRSQDVLLGGALLAICARPWSSTRLRWHAAPASRASWHTQTPGPKQYTSIRYGERLTEIGAVPSIGSVGDSYDNALAESVNALYKTELIYGPDQGPWRTVDEVELGTLMSVKWYNEERIHGYLNNIPPAEYDDAYHAERSGKQLIGNQ
jgi:putative transposase